MPYNTSSCGACEIMENAYKLDLLPLKQGAIDQTFFLEELIDATAKLEIYKEKIKDSKLGSHWFMPTLQQKEALASSQLEGTQATLYGVLINQVLPNKKDINLNEIYNYYEANIGEFKLLMLLERNTKQTEPKPQKYYLGGDKK